MIQEERKTESDLKKELKKGHPHHPFYSKSDSKFENFDMSSYLKTMKQEGVTYSVRKNVR